MILTDPISILKGVGEQRSDSFSQSGIDSIRDLLYTFPRRYLDRTNVIASPINETNELSGAKSLFIPLKLASSNANISPVVDLDRASLICVGNVLNSIDSSDDVFANLKYL